MIDTSRGSPAEAVRFLSRQQQRILTFAESHEKFSRVEVELILRPDGSGGGPVEEEIAEMVQMGLLEPHGGQRGRTYSLCATLPPHAPRATYRSSVADEEQRKASLRELDQCLEVLEMVNLTDQRTLPADLPQRLQSKGVPFYPGMSAPEAIEAVFDAQAKYMLSLETELEAEDAEL
ncbi:MAG: hypothetical protein ACYDGR_07200 [Candidatus Dormibacteria bacterium]